MKDPLKLKDEVSKSFDLVGTKAGKVKCAKFGVIDLCAISAADAQTLVDAGFPYLKKKDTPDSKENKVEKPV